LSKQLDGLRWHQPALKYGCSKDQFGRQPALVACGVRNDWLAAGYLPGRRSNNVAVLLLLLLQVVRTTVEPVHGKQGSAYDAYEYIAHSHTYMSDNQPTAKFTYDLSPIQVRGSG